jgi:hypothetical protein
VPIVRCTLRILSCSCLCPCRLGSLY